MISTIIASVSIVISLLVAFVQIRTQIQEFRPYLSYEGMSERIKIVESTGCAGIEFNINLRNVGKCVLNYEMVSLDIFINGLKLPEVALKNRGSIIGVNGRACYNKYYNDILKYEINLPREEYIPTNYKIIFNIEYGRASSTKRKYKLSYEIDVEFDNGYRKENYGKTFAN